MLNHLGIIPDGNRRWARKRGKPVWFGHSVGIKRFRDVIDWCIELGVKEITFYTLSVQNFKRNKKELNYLFKIIRRELDYWEKKNEAASKGVRINPIGRLGMLPKDVRGRCLKVKRKTAKNTKIKVNLAVGYGGREEIVHAVKQLLRKKQKVNEKNISKNLWLNSEPELVIRTSGEYRTSNFLIWQTHYSEWFFSKKYWPAFDKNELVKALKEYRRRERRVGK